MENNESSLNKRPDGFLIVGIGASAGGIQALKEFFQHVPGDSGMAYVVILHLSPDHDSQLAHVLQVVAAIPVLQVMENTKIEPDHIYVVPPNQHLVIHDDSIAPSVNVNMEERRAPVDIFFRNLAETHGPRAVSVILSGTGANGSMGMKRIKEMGGVAYVQNPREAEFNEMPRNAIATELVDEVLPVAEIPVKIIAYRNNLGRIQIIVEPEKRPEPQQQALREIFTLLRIRTGHDFSNYKRPTLLRRIERRINIRNLHSLPDYTAFLRDHPEEAVALLKDLLISVTNFFRDKKAFEALELQVLPAIVKQKKREDELRIWVAGCATGEEAYSIAMLCAERTIGKEALNVQIFATDIDEAAITAAREGYYTLNDAADVSPDRLRRFFNKEGDGYRVRREIREMVIFANHNFLKDPPFSRLDLITCRNVLIYINATAQERVVETFHFALNPGGYLFLGSSESVDGASDLFVALNREQHIFQAREVAARHFPLPVSVPNFQFKKNDPVQKPEETESRTKSRISFGELHQRLLEQYAPPSVVINHEYDIVHMSEKAGKYLEFQGGEPTQNLLKLVRAELRLELRSALYQAVQRNISVEARSVKLVLDGQPQVIDIKVRPVLNQADTSKGFILVIFQQKDQAVDTEETVVIPLDEPVARQLEEELVNIKAQLRNSVEQHEFQAEELKASNEELQAMNEELRSAAEELETSKEELQSINEELRTVNQELKVKIEETRVTNNNLQNLINSANIGTMFLDRSFCIRMFTPAVLDVFNLIPADYARPISDITHKLQYDGLLQDAETVLDKLTVVEREVATTDNRWYMMRVLPYRTSEDRINGVVITFFDITRIKKTEQALQKSEEYLRLLIESAKDYAILTLDTNRRVISWSTGAEAMLGYSEQEVIGRSGDIIFTPEDRDKNAPEKEAKTAENEGRAENERWHVRKDGSRFWGSGSSSSLRDNTGTLLGFVKIMRDLTEQKQAQEALRMSEQRLQRMMNVSYVGVLTFDYEGTMLHANDAFLEMVGYNRGEFEAQQFTWQYFTPPEYVEVSKHVVEQLRETGRGGPYEKEYFRKDGSRIWLLFVNADLKDGTIVEYAIDISDRKKAEAAVRNTAERLQLALDAGKLGTYEYDFQTGEYISSAQHKANFGYTEDEPVTLENLKERIVPADRAHMETAIGKAPNKDAVYATEYRTQLPDGDVRWIRSVGRFVYNETGEPQKMVGITLDITEEKAFTEELSKLVKERTIELQQSNNDLRQFAHVASHDLKEPVRKIQTFNNRVLDEFDGELPAKVRTYLQKIGNAADRMVSMIDGVLRYSKLGNMEAAFAPVNLNQVIQNIETDLEVLIQEKAAVVTKTGLPTITANPILMYQLFYNLILNSLKFSKEGEPPRISLSAETEKVEGKDFTRIILTDNGIGFEPEYNELIFQTFVRLHPTDAYEGTGIGLALCKKIVERHGGTITASGEPGKGATFTIVLPSS